jgi:hypothetical protein
MEDKTTKKDTTNIAPKNSKSRHLPTIDYKWECRNCKFLLGYISRDLKTVRIKYRDLFVTVQNGNVTQNCRRCGEQNTLTQNREGG